MTKKRQRTRSRQLPADRRKTVYVSEYEITTDPIYDRRYKRLPRYVKDVIERLHTEAQTAPHKAIPELLEWIKKHPRVPVFYNHLSVAYGLIGQQEKMRDVVLENYRRNPDYLFARLNYAELCLEQGDYEQVTEIFEHKFDLKLLYPKRNRFHISEVPSFMGLIGVYFSKIGERDSAVKYYDILREIAPDFEMTKRLRRELFPGLLRRLLRRLFGRAKSQGR
jgi:tetratricopeptide (TPR) repeat protein